MAPQASFGNYGFVALLLCSSLLIDVDLVKGSTGENILHSLAQDFCDKVAASKKTTCVCVDSLIIPAKDNNACKITPRLGEKLDVQIASFKGMTGFMPIPTAIIYHRLTCDSRTKQNTPCVMLDHALPNGTTSVATTLELGVPIDLKITWLKFGQEDGQAQFEIAHVGSSSTISKAFNKTIQQCQPPKGGLPAGSCLIYTVQYYAINLAALDFSYYISIIGGVQMTFGQAIDGRGAIGLKSNGTRSAWWFSLADIVKWGQSNAGNITNASLFDYPHNSETEVDFHSSGSFGKTTVDSYPHCVPSTCT